MISVLVPEEKLTRASITIDGDTHHHLVRVRRVSSNEQLRLVDGQGNARWGRITGISKDEVRVDLGERAPTNEPALEIELLIAAPKPSRASWLVEKATEIGVVAMGFIQTDRAPAGYRPETLKRLSRVAASAVEQSHRSRVPVVSGIHLWQEAREILRNAGCPCHFLDTRADGFRLPRVESGRKILAVGPEGGWSDRERRELIDLGCQALGLGPTTLRVETAAIVGAFWMLRAG